MRGGQRCFLSDAALLSQRKRLCCAEARLQTRVVLAQGLDGAALEALLAATPEQVAPLLQEESAKAAALARHFPSVIDDGACI